MRNIGEIIAGAVEAAEQPLPANALTSPNRLARQIRTALRRTMDDLINNVPGSGWTGLQSTWVFQLKNGVQSYALPPDYAGMIPDTEYRGGSPLRLRGPISPAMWSAWRYGYTLPAMAYGWRIRRDRIYVDPVPTADELVTIDYVSRFQAIQKVAGWDTSLWDSEPGQQAQAPYVTYEGHLAATATDLGLTDAEYTARFQLLDAPEGWDATNDTDGDGYDDAFVRKAFFTADSDFAPVRDELVEYGMTWRLRRVLGLPYAQDQMDYERMKDTLYSADGGGARDLILGACDGGDDVVFAEDGSGTAFIT